MRSTVTRHSGPPRWAKFRAEAAQVNSWLDTHQDDLLNPSVAASANALCAMLVVTADPHAEDLSMPAFVGLGIPPRDLTGWYELLSLAEWMALYHDADTSAQAPAAPEVVLKDIAIPKLKRRGGDN